MHLSLPRSFRRFDGDCRRAAGDLEHQRDRRCGATSPGGRHARPASSADLLNIPSRKDLMMSIRLNTRHRRQHAGAAPSPAPEGFSYSPNSGHSTPWLGQGRLALGVIKPPNARASSPADGGRGDQRQYRHRPCDGLRPQGLSSSDRDGQSSVERRRLMRFLGARGTDTASEGTGMVAKARELAATHGWF